MKKIALLLAFFLVSFHFATAQKIDTGTYTANSPSAETIKLILAEDNKFHLTLISGTYEQQNDSIYFHPHGENLPVFEVSYVTAKSKSDKIKINLGKSAYFAYYSTYFGTQKINENTIEYQTLEERLKVDPNNEDYTEKEYAFDIDRAAFVYLVQENLGQAAQIEKYEVPENVVELKIKKSNTLFNKLKLKGVYNPNTRELIVSEGKSPIAFIKSKDDNLPYAFVKPLETKEQKYWTYPGKPNQEDEYPAADSTVVDYDYQAEKPPYVFKIQTEKSLTDALKVAQKSPEKVLVIFYDTSKTAQDEFKTYLKNYETNTGYLMYDKYNPEYDRANFYLATDNDKNTLKKWGVTEPNSIVFLNTKGTKLYHCKGKMTDYDFSEYNLNYLVKEVMALNTLAQLDHVMANKKATLPQVEEALFAVVKSERSFVSDVVATVAPPKVNFDTRENDFNAVDTTAAVVQNYDYSMLKEKHNAYQFQSTSDAIALKYKQILEAHAKDSAFHPDLVRTILSELSNTNGFSHKLFGKQNEKLSLADFQSIDYLLKFFDAIPTIQTEDYTTDYSKRGLINTITYALNREANATQFDKVNEYYQKLAQVSNNHPKVLRGQLEFVKEKGSQAQYINAFEDYFDGIFPTNSNVIEQLDKAYNPDEELTWYEFKYSFANSANDAAWYVVEKLKATNPNALQKAIRWSETSLIIEKENHYFLDTLAQLYYLNGQKEKGIQFEQKAIDAALVSSESSTIEDYKEVLEKMKNGSY